MVFPRVITFGDIEAIFEYPPLSWEMGGNPLGVKMAYPVIQIKVGISKIASTTPNIFTR